MHDTTTELMRTLIRGIEVDEDLATHLATLANEAAMNGYEAFAAAFVANGRLHRVKAIQLRAQLGALVEMYGPRQWEQG